MRSLILLAALCLLGLFAPMILVLFPVFLLLGAMLVATVLLAWLLTGMTYPISHCRSK